MRIIEVRQIVRGHRVRLIHSNSLLPIKAILPGARAARIPIGAHLHPLVDQASRLYAGFHQVSLAVGVSHVAAQGLLDDAMPIERVTVVDNGIDESGLLGGANQADRAAPRARGWRSPSARSGGPTARTRSSGPSTPAAHHLLAVGDGPDRALLQAQAHSLGIAARMPFERGSVGAPLRLSDIAGNRDALPDGTTSLLVQPLDDAATLAGKLALLADDATLRRRLGPSGADRGRAHFLHHHDVRAKEALYQQLLSAPRSSFSW